MASNANAEVVSKAEHNQMKRNLESEIEERKKQMKMMEALIAKGFQFPTKRARICLTVPDFAKTIEQMKAMKGDEEFSVVSAPVEVAGFQWKLDAYGYVGHFGFFLRATPPAKYAEEGFFKFEVDFSFHLLGNTPSHDIHKTASEDSSSDEPDLEMERWMFEDEEDMATFPHNFLQPDGSIHAELDFTVKSAKFCWDDEDTEGEEQNEENGSLDAAAHVDVPAGGVQTVQQQPGSSIDA